VKTRALLLLTFLAAACGGGESNMNPDGGVTSCDDIPEGGRCDNTTLITCVGGEPSSTDCSATGDVCGADPSNPSASACIDTGQDCGNITYDGVCNGDTLSYCYQNQLQVVNCASSGLLCDDDLSGQGKNCVSACDAAGADEPSCASGSSVRHCVYEDGRFAVRTDECPSGYRCTESSETEYPGCIPTTATCSSLGPQGGCSNGDLVTCVSGARQTTDCGSEVCAYAEGGYTCAPSGASGAFTVSGTIRFEKRVIIVEGADAYLATTTTTRPARNVSVAIVTAAGDVLAYASTADDGTYTVRFDAAGGTQVHALVATTTDSATRPIRVVRLDGLVHGLASAEFAAASRTLDMVVTDASGLAGAFNIFDVAVTAQDRVRGTLSIAEPDEILLAWERGASLGVSWYSGPIYLTSGFGDDDGYDDPVIAHEIGHHFEDHYGRSDNPGGYHDGSPADPNLGWSEGFATYWAGVVLTVPVYADTSRSGGWAYDMEESVTTANPSGGLTQDTSEDMVSQLLWDLGDGTGEDTFAGTHPAVLEVQKSYLAPDTSDRGEPGVDLVDFLDGFLSQGGAGLCTGVNAMVARYTFPYTSTVCQ
jgi:hypothetical protein